MSENLRTATRKETAAVIATAVGTAPLRATALIAATTIATAAYLHILTNKYLGTHAVHANG